MKPENVKIIQISAVSPFPELTDGSTNRRHDNRSYIESTLVYGLGDDSVVYYWRTGVTSVSLRDGYWSRVKN